jgi:hypothetical protein
MHTPDTHTDADPAESSQHLALSSPRPFAAPPSLGPSCLQRPPSVSAGPEIGAEISAGSDNADSPHSSGGGLLGASSSAPLPVLRPNEHGRVAWFPEALSAALVGPTSAAARKEGREPSAADRAVASDGPSCEPSQRRAHTHARMGCSAREKFDTQAAWASLAAAYASVSAHGHRHRVHNPNHVLRLPSRVENDATAACAGADEFTACFTECHRSESAQNRRKSPGPIGGEAREAREAREMAAEGAAFARVGMDRIYFCKSRTKKKSCLLVYARQVLGYCTDFDASFSKYSFVNRWEGVCAAS